MVNHKNKLCEFLNCNKQPNFNIEGQKTSKFCFEHKLSNMINIIHKKCKLCPTLVKNKHEGYCLRCFIYTFPDKPVTRNYKTKEKTVTDYVLSTFSEYDWITDKKIQDGCSSRRPDMLLDLGYQVIIVSMVMVHHMLILIMMIKIIMIHITMMHQYNQLSDIIHILTEINIMIL
jgi:hypothetical protein